MFNREEVLYSECQCSECRRHYYSMYYRKAYCAYLAGMVMLVEQELREKELGDATDKRAIMLMNAFTEQRANRVVSDTIGKADSKSDRHRREPESASQGDIAESGSVRFF